MIEFADGVAVAQQELKLLWEKAFGDEQSFIETFFATAYDPECCRVAIQDGKLAGMLFWFDCSLASEKIAYIYGVATDPSVQGQGVATELMKNVHSLLQNSGYSGAILVPGSEKLFHFYEKRGYVVVGRVSEGVAQASESVRIERVDADAYGQLREKMLPPNAVHQQGRNMAFLDRLADCYCGDGFVAAISKGETKSCMEYLGDVSKISGLAGALGCGSLRYRHPGQGRAFAMGMSFRGASFPQDIYFGLAFD